MLKEYCDIFNGIGTLLGDEYHITLKKDHVPVQHPTRMVPVKLKSVYKEEFQCPCNEGLIAPIQECTEWTSTTFLARKTDGSPRLYSDPKDLNKNIQRNYYYARTIDELSAEPHRPKCFILRDSKLGY